MMRQHGGVRGNSQADQTGHNRALEAVVAVALAVWVCRPAIEVPHELRRQGKGAHRRRHLHQARGIRLASVAARHMNTM